VSYGRFSGYYCTEWNAASEAGAFLMTQSGHATQTTQTRLRAVHEMAAQRHTSPYSATKGCQGTPTAQRGLNAPKRAYTRHKLKAGLQERTKFAPETLPRGERAPRVGVEVCQAKGSAKQVHGSFTGCEIISANEKSAVLGFGMFSSPKLVQCLLDVSYCTTETARTLVSDKTKKIKN